MKRLSILSMSLLGFWAVTAFKAPKATFAPKMNLSEYGFFVGNMSELKPASDVVPYDLNAPLFSDYAWKARFFRLPAGAKVTYSAQNVFEFPVGSVIGKSFYFPKDFRHPENGRTLLETRLLIREEKGWKALTYIWNTTQTDATLEVAGERIPIAWTHFDGTQRQLEYSVPNVNQCKSCHEFDKAVVPLGPTARELNMIVSVDGHEGNQLEMWKDRGVLDTLPNTLDVPRLADWQNSLESTEERARAYLDANCGHCHNPHGTANTSGLFLQFSETDPSRLGVMKAPIAAGKGSGGFKFDIVPQKPDESILLYRMKSLDPGVMMPEAGRKSVHEEGIALLREWIATMDKDTIGKQ